MTSAHRVLLPPAHVVGSIDRSYFVSAESSCSSYTIKSYENDTRTPRDPDRPCPIASGLSLSRSGFALSAASVSSSLRPSSPPRSARRGFTASDHLALNNIPSTPPGPELGYPPNAAPLSTPWEPQLIFPPHSATDASGTQPGLSATRSALTPRSTRHKR